MVRYDGTRSVLYWADVSSEIATGKTSHKTCIFMRAIFVRKCEISQDDLNLIQYKCLIPSDVSWNRNVKNYIMFV